MTLLEIMDMDGWKALEREIHQLTGMNPGVFDAKGAKLTDLALFGNALCPRIKGSPEGRRDICATANQVLSGRAAKTGTPVVEECDAGMLKIVVPILSGGEFIGTIGACGGMLEGSEPDLFHVGKIIGQDPAALSADAAKAPRLSRQRADELAAWMAGRIPVAKA